jgi:hypothetical protein
MIAKGNLHSDGIKLAAYLVKGHPGERAELVQMRGFADSDLRTAFRDIEIQARDTDADAAFFHCYVRLPKGESLTQEQWINKVADGIERRLGFTGQARAISFHTDRETGDRHMHMAWSRIARSADGRLYAIDPGLYKNKLKEISRRLEKELDLKQLANERTADNRARAGDRNEFEEARRLGTDIKAIRSAILDCFEKSDNGKALKAALEDRGLQLANGDRRDCFVVIDAAGGQHALNKKLTGLTLAATRTRLADLDRAQLPGVEKAKELQADRRAARTAQEREKHRRGVEAPGQAATRSDGQQRAPQSEIKPLGKTAGEIRLAWQLTRGAEAFARALEDRGLALVYVSAEEARDSERARAFAKAIDRQNRALKEGFAVVDARGNVTRIDQRTTGDLKEEIDKRLGGIDRSQLLNVAAAREVMREASRAAWQQQQQTERDKARPASAIETAILECERRARIPGVVIERDGQPVRLTGGAGFAAALDQAGIAVVRVTAADVQALDVLRREDKFAAVAAEFNREAYRPHHFAELGAGEFAAVTRNGEVHRLNPHKLDLESIERQLTATQPRLASVVEARAGFEIKREETAALWAERRDEATRASALRSENRDAEREARTAANAGRDLRNAATAGDKAVAKVSDGAARGLRAAMSAALNFFASMFSAPPPLTRDQAERAERADEERAELRAEQQERTEAQDWQLIEQQQRQQQDELETTETEEIEETETLADGRTHRVRRSRGRRRTR